MVTLLSCRSAWPAPERCSVPMELPYVHLCSHGLPSIRAIRDQSVQKRSCALRGRLGPQGTWQPRGCSALAGIEWQHLSIAKRVCGSFPKSLRLTLEYGQVVAGLKLASSGVQFSTGISARAAAGLEWTCSPGVHTCPSQTRVYALSGPVQASSSGGVRLWLAGALRGDPLVVNLPIE